MIKGKNTVRIATLLHFVFIIFDGYAQERVAKNYPKDYFRNPLDIPMSLTANFGELRPDHWHMGLDLRTNQKENLPVYAAAGGYVAHIGIRPLSFGRYMIVNHPNGYSTLYAHLNEFFSALQQFVKQMQIKEESWPVELDFTEDLFKVKKGDFIALSGNTGGSQGPHLHFEIRDTETGRSLNPLLFDFDIKDDVPPVITRLAMYDRNISTYLQTPRIINVKKTDSGYYTNPRKIVTGFKKISFAIGAYDRLSGSSTPDGIYSALLYYDQLPQTEFVLDDIDYKESVYINAHIDYRYRFNVGTYLQHISKLPGDHGNIYHEIDGNGVIELKDTMEHFIHIEISDAYDNLSELFFTIQYNDSLAQMIKGQNTATKFFYPGFVNILEEKDFEAYLPETCLYDTAGSSYYSQNIFSPGAVSAMHKFNDPSVPLHDNFQVRIKPTINIPGDQKNKIVIVRDPIATGWQGNRTVKKAQWQSGWIAASFGDFGNFQAYVDLSPPQINSPGKGKDTIDLSQPERIVFTPTDNYGIKSFRAELDGKWLMFTNDKARNYIYNFDEQCPFGVHELKVRVEDIVGNVTEKTWWFKRYPYTPPPKKKVSHKKKAAKKVIQK